MRSSNPALNEKVFNREIEEARASGAGGRMARPPVDDRVSPWTPPASADTMTVSGTISATAVLLMLLLAAAWVGWAQVDPSPEGVRVPGWILPALLVGLGIAVLTVFKPKLARFTSPVYALVEGLLLGAISHVFHIQYEGIVVQAVGLTLGVFGLLLFLYATRVIKVTDKLRTGIIVATGSVFLVYMVSLVLRLFGANVPFIHDGGPIGILFSLAVVAIASLNLLLDFDFIEKGAAQGAPKYMEWYGAFGLMVTLVWLYLELLRLLSKLRSR
jgi:uncharacterized YccA/Bax inhibitor family protein